MYEKHYEVLLLLKKGIDKSESGFNGFGYQLSFYFQELYEKPQIKFYETVMQLKKENYIELRNSKYQITPFGEFAFEEFKELKEMRLQKEKDDAIIARNTVSDYKRTKTLAILAFIISVVLLLSELIEVLNKYMY